MWFYGDMNDDHGEFGVAIDDGPLQTASSFSPTLHEQQVLYAAELAPGAHTIVVKNLGDNKALGIDQFVCVAKPCRYVASAVR